MSEKNPACNFNPSIPKVACGSPWTAQTGPETGGALEVLSLPYFLSTDRLRLRRRSGPYLSLPSSLGLPRSLSSEEKSRFFG